MKGRVHRLGRDGHAGILRVRRSVDNPGGRHSNGFKSPWRSGRERSRFEMGNPPVQKFREDSGSESGNPHEIFERLKARRETSTHQSLKWRMRRKSKRAI